MWKSVLTLTSQRAIVEGSEAALVQAIGAGADLRVYTEFRYNEHIDTASDNDEIVREVSEFGVTYLIDGSWAGGIMSLRQPVHPPHSFGPNCSMSFFLYNQNGQQAIARPYFDGRRKERGDAPLGEPGPGVPASHEDMPKYHPQTSWDDETNAPSQNFIYDFECYRFCVNDGWREMFSTDENGETVSGSLDELMNAFSRGSEIKVGVRNLCSELGGGEKSKNEGFLQNEIFVQTGSGYYNSGQKLFSAGSHPVVRVAPAKPLLYASHNWDFGWLFLRTDGRVQYRRCDPYTLKFEDRDGRYALRWFVRD